MSELSTQVKSTSPPVKSLGELDLSNFKSLIEEAKQSQTSLATSEDFGITEGNNLWRAHVQTWLGKSDRITWTYPINIEERKKLESTGQGEYEEVSTSAPQHHFVGVRGIVLKTGYGRKLKRPKEGDAKTMETVCHTTMLENEISGQTITDRMPMEVPLGMIHWNKDNPHELNRWLANRPYLKLYGSRPPVGMGDEAKTSKVRTCAECVAAGDHYIGTLEEFVDPKKSIPKCSLDGYMLFCVFQLGLLDSSQVLQGGKVQVKWVDVKDAQLTRQLPDGSTEPRTAPFILKINGLTNVQHWDLGSGNFKRDIVTTGKQCVLPDGAKVYSWGEYFNKYLHAKNVSSEPRKLDLSGTTVYPVVTDLVMAKLKNDEYQASHLPVYSPVLDPEVIDRGEGLTQLDWLQAALQCLQYEEALVRGEVVSSSPNALPGEAPEVISNDSSAQAKVIEPAATTNAPAQQAAAPPKTSFAAFSPPPTIE